MKYYLLLLLFVIMGAGARTMFEIAHHALGREHGFAPAADTTRLMLLTLWYIAMMIIDVILLNNKEFRFRNIMVGILSTGVLIPTVYMFLTHR